MSFSSDFSKQLASDASIVDLMSDLGNALNVNPSMLFLGGGNPARIPEFEQYAANHLKALIDSPEDLHKLLGVYQSPRGSEQLIKNLSAYLRTHNWPVTERNICITSGSQTAFFMLLNLLAGPSSQARTESAGQDLKAANKRICLPLVPEYLGYADQGLGDDMFYAVKPKIELIGDHKFKYHINFDELELDDSVAAICVSRPTNPSGNMIPDTELKRLSELAAQQNIPLIVDCAYGAPFPGVVYRDSTMRWESNCIYVMSVSKLGLPGARTGIVVADEPVIDALVQSNTVISLASGNLGPALLNKMIEAGELDSVCQDMLLPFYEQKRDFALATIESHFDGLNYRIHESEGAFFLWLWFPDLPISSIDFYQRLKEKNVLVMAGEYFFFGLERRWGHAQQCIRITFCAENEVLLDAIKIIAEELRDLP